MTNKSPTAPMDSTWEYLSVLRNHTIQLCDSITNICTGGLNYNISEYYGGHQVMEALVNPVLQEVLNQRQELNTLYARHKDLTGPAMQPETIADYLGLCEQYSGIQAKLYHLNDTSVAEIYAKTKQAIDALKPKQTPEK